MIPMTVQTIFYKLYVCLVVGVLTGRTVTTPPPNVVLSTPLSVSCP